LRINESITQKCPVLFNKGSLILPKTYRKLWATNIKKMPFLTLPAKTGSSERGLKKYLLFLGIGGLTPDHAVNPKQNDCTNHRQGKTFKVPAVDISPTKQGRTNPAANDTA